MYLNSLLATLNNREALSAKLGGVVFVDLVDQGGNLPVKYSFIINSSRFYSHLLSSLVAAFRYGKVVRQ